jgi:hypothetical protein
MAEKARGVTVSILGLGLGVFQLILGFLIVYFWFNFSLMIAEIVKTFGYYAPPAYLVGLLDATKLLVLFGGIYVILHAIKRIVDYAFKAYIASKQQT